MLRLLLVSCFTGIHFLSLAQGQDFISVRKKNGRPLKTFIAGSPIIFETVYGTYVSGPIEAIKNDSVFVKIYDIRTFATNLGFAMVDTISTYIAGFHYKDIRKIRLFNKERFIRSKIDKLLIIGGAGYFILNVVNGAYFNEPITDKKNLRSLAISLGAVGTGLLINKFFKVSNFSTGKHKIVYVNMK